MASLWYGFRVNEKELKQLAKKYKIKLPKKYDEGSEDDDQFSYQCSVITAFSNKIEGLQVGQFGYCCREPSGYIIGVVYESISSEDGHSQIKSVNDKNTRVDTFLTSHDLNKQPAYYLVANDCRVCGS